MKFFFLLNCKVIILLFAGVEYTQVTECVYYFYTVIHFSLYTFKHSRKKHHTPPSHIKLTDFLRAKYINKMYRYKYIGTWDLWKKKHTNWSLWKNILFLNWWTTSRVLLLSKLMFIIFFYHIQILCDKNGIWWNSLEFGIKRVVKIYDDKIWCVKFQQKKKGLIINL